jgi:hypothetical protein
VVAAAGGNLMTRTAGLFAVAIFLCLAGASSASAGVASYVFEPTLSLTGNCNTSLKDSVPDPGTCPIPPGVPGVDHPSAGFKDPNVTTDAYGDIYVVSGEGEARRVDVFSAKGLFLTEFEDNLRPLSIAVDSKGNVYLTEEPSAGEKRVVRFPPSLYKPEEEKIKYEKPSVVVANGSTLTPPLNLFFGSAVAVDAKDRLYVDAGGSVSIFKSAEEGNEPLKLGAIKGLVRSQSIAVDSVHKKIYLSEKDSESGKSVIQVYEWESPYAKLEEDEIDGSNLPGPQKEFITEEGAAAVGVDDDTGHVFVNDSVAGKVYEFAEDGTYLATIEHSFEEVPNGQIAIDDGPFSPRPQAEGWLFVPSGRAPTAGHVYAFEPKEECAAEVEAASVGGVTETEAVLHATINPCGLPTEYRLEYISQQQYEEEGESFANATVAGEGILPKGGEGVSVSAPASELESGREYRFRAFAENAEGASQTERLFETFEKVSPPPPCPNQVFRTGPSALLPDCRAYELVTPPDTNGHAPVGGFASYGFPVLRSSLDGTRVSFLIEGGTLPGFESPGSFDGDPYLATRGGDGWSSSSIGPSSKEANGPKQRGISPDQAYTFWNAVNSLALHIRYPDGHSELVGRGSLGEEPVVNSGLITEGATHIVFQTKSTGGNAALQLEPDAPPTGTGAVYDRSAGGPTHVVSLLPGDETPKEGEDARYLGASEEGEGIAFEIKGTIYLRLHNAQTFEVAGPGATFAGVAAGGSRVFYLEGGNLFAYDAAKEETIPFSSSGDVTPVNVAAIGTRAYFVSPSVLTGEPNPNGEEAKKGVENLYLSEEGTISFVGVVTKRDVEGEHVASGQVGGLGLWVEALGSATPEPTPAPAKDPSRATPSGTTFLFESRANLTGFESDGFAQVYRYDASEGRLDCLSCSPTGTPPTSDASLQSIQAEQFFPQPAGDQLKIANQTPDGKRAFFQTAEPLVVGDTDEQLDVYEWEEDEVGGCEKFGGCVYLISGGHSVSPDYLFAMSASGDDVFFRTADRLLLPRDTEATLSIYDARVNGGFAEPNPGIPCASNDTCQGSPTPPPSSPQATTGTGSDGNFSGAKCPKGKHKVKRHGEEVCVKKHHKKKHHRAGQKKKGASR